MIELERLTTDQSKDAETLAGISFARVGGRGIWGGNIDQIHRANGKYIVCINLALKRLTVGDSGELMIIMPEKVR